VCERAVLLESLFLIRIGSRDPVQRFLVQQRLIGAGNEPFAFSGIPAIVAATSFLVATVCFFEQSLNLLYHLATILLKKQDSPMPPYSVAQLAMA
jgi:hypothetical protein